MIIVPALAAMFEFMDALDPGHFEGLCKVAKIDSRSILLGSCEPVEETDHGGSGAEPQEPTGA